MTDAGRAGAAAVAAERWEHVGGAGTTADGDDRFTRATRVVLVRHGETEWNSRGVYQGWHDVPLAASGREQAAALARSLANVHLDAAYSSPLARARETADVVLAGRGVAPLAVPALRELSYGAWEGLTPEARRAASPGLDERWSTDPWGVRFPGGETLDALAQRVMPVWQRLLAAHVGDTILISAHGHVNRLILLHVRRLPRQQFWSMAQPNGSATLLHCLAPARQSNGSA